MKVSDKIMKSYIKYLIQWLKQEVGKAQAQGVIVGLSGGVDSAVVAALSKAAFASQVKLVFIDLESTSQDYKDALSVAHKLDLNLQKIDLTPIFKSLSQSLNLKNKLAIANLKPRLRMSVLYALAQELGYLVLGTDNAAEWILGYFTKYGDGAADLQPLVRLTKTEVKKIAQYFNLPTRIYTKSPSAGLWLDQEDEQELGFKYDDVDRYLTNSFLNPNVKAKIKAQIQKTQHKRDPIPWPKPVK